MAAMKFNKSVFREKIQEWMQEISVVLDSGILVGEPSTIVDLTDPDNPEILREGKGDISLIA